MNISNSVKKRFTKDQNIPITILDEPYFSYYVDLFNCTKKWNSFVQCLNSFSNEGNFFKTSDEIINRAIEYIKGKDSYKAFCDLRIPNYRLDEQYSSDIYKDKYDNKYFISFDIRNANYQTFAHYDEHFFGKGTEYAAWIMNFVPDNIEQGYEHFTTSKQIRQIIFGNTNPKNQNNYQKNILIPLLLEALSEYKHKLVAVSSDEIVFEYDKMLESEHLELLKDVNLDVKMECFKLYKVPTVNNEKIFIKMVLDFDLVTDYKIKCCPSYFYPQVMKKIKQMKTGVIDPINDLDLSFYFESQICRFTNPIMELK
jgi:hypothetical protein